MDTENRHLASVRRGVLTLCQWMCYLRRKVAAARYFRWIQKQSALGIAVTRVMILSGVTLMMLCLERGCPQCHTGGGSWAVHGTVESLTHTCWFWQLLVMEERKEWNPNQIPAFLCCLEILKGSREMPCSLQIWDQKSKDFSPENCSCPVTFSQQREKTF